MADRGAGASHIDQRIAQLFSQVSEALAAATVALLGGEPDTGQAVVDADHAIDVLAADLAEHVWSTIDQPGRKQPELRRLVGVLLILPELERSADLAEHIAQRAVANLGAEMTPVSRGIVQRMSEVALSMWERAADAYADRGAQGAELDEADEELDILHQRLTKEVALDAMSSQVAAQLTLVARFYERLGDHAVNLARRIESLPDDRAEAHDGTPGQPVRPATS